MKYGLILTLTAALPGSRRQMIGVITLFARNLLNGRAESGRFGLRTTGDGQERAIGNMLPRQLSALPPQL